MLRSRHWIAARLNVLRIASAAALAKTAHGAGTWDVGWTHPATPVQTPIPSVEGYRPQAAGWFPPQDATPVQTSVSDI
ncbi:MAG: hypothetical protein LBM98_00705 [Oscillospiraceae bacterium]|nr:hypothetical protein [Oscillospiraceae bacterium]